MLGFTKFFLSQDKANPTALILSSVMMLRYMDLYEHAKKIEDAVYSVIR
jgi:isocitrate dehydrogenase (NAD+)